MAYIYYCTHCGRQLSQETVYFDMQPVLNGYSTQNVRKNDDKQPFKILKFRMTKSELEAMVAAGTPKADSYVCCKLTFQELMNYISNQNNLNNPVIATLTFKDAKDYTEFRLDEGKVEEKDNDIDDIFGGQTEKPKEEKVETAQDEKPVSAAILALEETNQKNQDKLLDKGDLIKDLQKIVSLFNAEEEYTFDILLNTEKDNEGKEVLIGYNVNGGIPKHITVANMRVCRYCKEAIFEHAGTAEHRSIAFIGDQKSGKTSTILALVHYAQNALQGVMKGDEIWKEAGAIDSVSTIELLSPSERLTHDLEYYKQGFAPAKTKANNRKDAYSATLRIKNKHQNKYYLLTFTDLPGELCDPETGNIDKENILNNFQVALACDAFVLCFDSETARDENANRMINNVCSWANQFQDYRAQHNESIGKDKGLKKLIPRADSATGLYAPVMLTFTKCRELEHPEEKIPRSDSANPSELIARTYIFDDERLLIDKNQIYQTVGDRFKAFDRLTNVYNARLRCSPYGYAAPSLEDVQKYPERMDNKKEYPEPKHIHLLMRWLLAVSGCIPVEGKYRPYIGSNSEYAPHPSFITHTQYRAISPRGAGKDGDVEEALARCYLFENPGKFDQDYLTYYDDNWILAKLRMKAKFQRN